MSDTREKTAGLAWWSIIETAGLIGLSLSAIIVIAHFLTPREVGIAALGLGIVQVFCMITEMLFHDALVQRRQLRRTHLDSTFWASLSLGLLFAFLCWAVADWVAALFGEPVLAGVLAWMGLSTIFSGLMATPLAMLRRDLQIRALALRSIGGRVGGAIVGIALAVAGFGVWALVAQQVVQVGTACAIVWILGRPRFRLRLSLARLRELLAFAMATMGALLIDFSKVRAFALILGYFLGAAALGYVNLAFRVVFTLRDVLEMVGNQMALPLFARRQHDLDATGRAFRAATELTCLIAMPVFAGLLAVSGDLVTVVFGAKWQPAIIYIQILAALSVVYFPQLYAASTLTALGMPRHNVLVSSVGFLITAIATVWAAQYGAAAAMVVWAGQQLAIMPLRSLLLRKAAGLGYLQQLRAAVAPFFAATAMAGFVLWMAAEPLDGLSPLERLPILVVLGGLVYPTLLLLIDPPALPRLYEYLVGGLLKRRRAEQAPEPMR